MRSRPPTVLALAVLMLRQDEEEQYDAEEGRGCRQRLETY